MYFYSVTVVLKRPSLKVHGGKRITLKPSSVKINVIGNSQYRRKMLFRNFVIYHTASIHNAQTNP